MLHLAEKAFWPARIPFPVMHVDTGHNFPEVIEYRDRRVAQAGVQLIVASVQESIDAGRVSSRPGRGPVATRSRPSRCSTAIEKHGFDAAFGGARRDEEKARAKERVFSFRDEFGQWDPKNQRPELWNLYNGRHHRGEHIRVFPLSNWTELDIWQYIGRERIELPSIYFAHRRRAVPPRRHAAGAQPAPAAAAGRGDRRARRPLPHRRRHHLHRRRGVRRASTVEDIIDEVAATRITERGATRADDRASEAAMEDRKKEGYF